MGIYFILACHSGDAFGVVLQPLPRLPIAVRYMEMVDIQKKLFIPAAVCRYGFIRKIRIFTMHGMHIGGKERHYVSYR